MTIVFLLMPRYIAPLDAVDALLADHVAWLDEHYAAGRFLASGRQVPRRGGVILADLADRATADDLTATDPFVRGGVATYDVVEFVASKVAPGLERLAPADRAR